MGLGALRSNLVNFRGVGVGGGVGMGGASPSLPPLDETLLVPQNTSVLVDVTMASASTTSRSSFCHTPPPLLWQRPLHHPVCSLTTVQHAPIIKTGLLVTMTALKCKTLSARIRHCSKMNQLHAACKTNYTQL